MKTNIIRESKIKGFNVVTSWEYDEAPDTSFLGTYANTPGEFAIPTGRTGGNYYKFFNADNVETMEQAGDNFREMERINNGDISAVGVVSVAYLHGVELGRSSVWGVFTDNYKIEQCAHVLELAGETEADATREAAATLAKLQRPTLWACVRSWADRLRSRSLSLAVTAALWAYPVAVLAWSTYTNVFRPR